MGNFIKNDIFLIFLICIYSIECTPNQFNRSNINFGYPYIKIISFKYKFNQ